MKIESWKFLDNISNLNLISQSVAKEKLRVLTLAISKTRHFVLKLTCLQVLLISKLSGLKPVTLRLIAVTIKSHQSWRQYVPSMLQNMRWKGNTCIYITDLSQINLAIINNCFYLNCLQSIKYDILIFIYILQLVALFT